jgi:hypothetical protein
MQYLTIEQTWIRGTSLLNRLQFGFSRSRLDGYNFLLDDVTLPRTTFTDLTFGIGSVTVTGLSAWGGSTTNPKYQTFSNYQLSDTVTWTRGPHSLKFGGTVEFLQYDLTSHFTSMGGFGFNSLDDFIANRPANFAAMMPESDASRELRQTVFGAFVQDDIRLRSNFTLNVGLRYEPTTDITETQGRLAQLIDFASTTATFNDTTVLDAIVQNPTLKTFAPRVGFAWSPGGRTAVRGGIGIFYDLLTVNVPLVQNTAVRVPPFISRGGLIRGAGFPFIDFPDAYFTQRSAIEAQAALEGMQYDPDQSVMYKWNVNVQREISPRTSIELGYSGTRGVNLWRHLWTNGREAVLNADGRLQVPAGQPLRQPNFQRMSFRGTDGTSDYHGFTVGMTRRAGANFQSQVSYTYSKSIDDGATSLGPLDFTNEGASGPRYLFGKDRGLSPHDLRHSFVANVSYRLPFGRQGGTASWLVRDWDVAGLVRLRSGYPFSVYTGIDQSLQQFAPRYPDLRPGADKNPILGGPDQYFDPTAFVLQPLGVIGNLGRNTLIGPGQATVDVTVSRQVPLGGTRALQLRVEVFNLLNRANFGLPSTNLFAANGTYLETAGRITSTATSARQAQLGIKFLW